jgi:lipopolysaccharide export system permease protein
MVLGGLAWMVQVLLLLKFIIKYGIDISGFIGMSIYTLPLLASIITPFVLFIAVMFIYNKSIASSEITICFASGQRPMTVARPAIAIGIIVTIIHLVANLYIVPKSQDMFYSAQWEMRYGLGHLKLKESEFNQIVDDVVIYVERASQEDLLGIIMRDGRGDKDEKIISAENGKLVNSPKGLSIVMGTGGLQITSKSGVMIGTFDGAQMEMTSDDSKEYKSLKVRRLPTSELIKIMDNPDDLTDKQVSKVVSEVANRFLSPFMDIIFVLIAVVSLLKASVLRRRVSFSAAIGTAFMVMAEITFMSFSAAISSPSSLIFIALGQVIVIIGLLWYLRK